MIAMDLVAALEDEGFDVVGPAATVAQGRALYRLEPVDGAVLDINLGGESVYALADELSRENVPFLFSTGYDCGMVPDRFAHVPCCQKPFDAAMLVIVIEDRIARPLLP